MTTPKDKEAAEIYMGLAHKMRNLAFGMSALIDAHSPPCSDSQIQEFNASFKRELDRLLNLLSQTEILYLASSINPGLHSLEDNLKEAVRFQQEAATEKKIEFAVQIQKNLPRLSMDPNRLCVAFKKSIENAVFFSPAEKKISISAQLNNDRIAVTVQDEGPGIEAKDIERIFEPFFSRRKACLGLGLSIARKIIQEHGGTISVSTSPQGAVFSADLPVT